MAAHAKFGVAVHQIIQFQSSTLKAITIMQAAIIVINQGLQMAMEISSINSTSKLMMMLILVITQPVFFSKEIFILLMERISIKLLVAQCKKLAIYRTNGKMHHGELLALRLRIKFILFKLATTVQFTVEVKHLVRMKNCR